MSLKKLIVALFVVTLVTRTAQVSAQEEENLYVDETQVLRVLDSLTGLTFFDESKKAIKAKKLNKYGFYPNEVPVYPDSVMAFRMAHINSGIPLVFNQHVKQFINVYAVRKRNHTERILGLSEVYFPIFEQVFDQENIPLNVKYLAIVESALNPNAVSPVGATGIWQFMYATGKMYDLNADHFLDERRDPYKATVAAAKFLKDLHNIYGDWSLALAAYNCGPGNVNKAIRRSGGKMDFWSIMPYLPAETRAYVPAYMAVAYVMNFSAEHNLYPVPVNTIPYHTDTLMVKGPIYFRDIANNLGIDYEELCLMNPSLKKQMIPQAMRSFPLRLPSSKILAFESLQDSIKSSSVFVYNQQPEFVREVISAQSDNSYTTKKSTYTVRRGDNLSAIAKKNGVTVSEIKQWNKLRSNTVMAGQKLVIKKEVKTPNTQMAANKPKITPENYQPTERNADGTASEQTTKTVTASATSTYKVKPGDTVYSISKKFSNVSMDDILKANNLSKNTTIRVGMSLKIPKA